MKTVALTCPNCGAQIQMPDGRTRCFCTYCGTQVALDDESVHVHVHTHDEAELKRLEFEREQDEENDQHRRYWIVALIVWIVVVTVLMSTYGLVEAVNQAVGDALKTFAGGVLLFGGIALFITRPRKRK